MTGALVSIAMFVLIALLLAGLWWYVRPQPRPTVDYTEEMPTWNFSFRTFTAHAIFNRKNLTLDGQEDSWRLQMRSCGRTMQSSNVRAIYFVHGTFVGHDPVGIVDMLKTVYPNIEKFLASKIRQIIKRQSDLLTRDLGNYTPQYIKLFSEAIGEQIPCQMFTWSSGNHHFARLDAAVRLLATLADSIRAQTMGSADRILLIGHSHAGQVFALMAQLLEYEQFGYRLYDILADAGHNLTTINSNLSTIKQVSIDFVTMGTPVIYSWPNSGYYRLLNIVNHRGTSHQAGSLKGILHTKDGDYIQQLGILGTDLLAATPAERRFNKRLDEIFGKGRDIKQWRSFLKSRMRVSPHGKTFLVNYLDDSRTLPNFALTLFGHGVYTKYETMLFNTRLIAEYFYKHNPR